MDETKEKAIRQREREINEEFPIFKEEKILE
jgi:hypothetical protein